MSDTSSRYLARAAARAEAEPFFIASALAAYRTLAGLDDRQLATWLGCPPENLPRLALCRRPDGESVMFSDEVQRIARYVEGDPGRLAHLLRAVENLAAMQGAAPTGLMAAQDREQDGSNGPRSPASGAEPPAPDAPPEGPR
jgi:hypothetical protein